MNKHLFLFTLMVSSFWFAHGVSAGCPADKDFIELQAKAQNDHSFLLADFIDLLGQRLSTVDSYCGYDATMLRYLMKAAITELNQNLKEGPAQSDSPTAFAHMTMYSVIMKAYSEGRFGFPSDKSLSECKDIFGESVPFNCRIVLRGEFSNLSAVKLPEGWQKNRMVNAITSSK